MIDKPILPDEEGFYVCKCDQKFSDLFEFLDHNGVKYEWGVRIARRWTFDMFEFIENLNEYLRQGRTDDMYESIQSAALTLLNASEGKFHDFMEEAVVAGEMDDIYKGVEKLLKEERHNDGTSEKE